MWGFFEKPPHTPKNLIGWFEQILRKFSIIQEWIIGLETPIPPLRTSTTVGIALSKLRKWLLRSNFLKFTYFIPHFKVCANKKTVSWGSKLQFFEPPVKMARKTLCVVGYKVSHNTICAESCQISTNYMAIARSWLKGFCATFPKKWHPLFLN